MANITFDCKYETVGIAKHYSWNGRVEEKLTNKVETPGHQVAEKVGTTTIEKNNNTKNNKTFDFKP